MSTATLLLPGLRRSLLLTTPILLSTPLLLSHQLSTTRIRCDAPDPLAKITSDLRLKQSSAPVLSPRVVKQISLGSVLGVLGGLGVSVFSKPLAVIIGLGVVFVQFLESRGIHIVPYSYLQNRLKKTNVRSLVQNNVALKMSFGLTFALAAFAEF
ncbi:hypothetical protein BU24DRAFT_429127 [Aaosphaeria arxii CBS 175.79]|uniref:FUN14-domain-containing protein n=1 Tax=Aaosphaeria arxii CBS 175.79 TaxID=1450172 RepID=A0A6A5X7Q5_9PLEO|nr:uncharacterized protein BU24DRAFT_429127 [Aaosphaeria arxii CBS 175.79]KAF2008847.1 hypothetical protein BU24DRAFT_429127 [Aaosphaeria arxii CBS 175.79]